MHPPFHDLMRDATRLTRAGRLDEATAAIQRALRAGMAAATPAAQPAAHPTAMRIDPSTDGPDAVADARPADRIATRLQEPVPRRAVAAATTVDADERRDGTQTHAGLTRAYRLYVPPRADDRPLPLVVMLHGCLQDPDDFAAGTGMDALARELGFLVLYPAQAADANPQRCWNWFKHTHQRRDRGEPGVIAAMTRTIIRTHGIDPRRVYVAGLSAGGAMAAVVGATYPDLFAAVGVHSGLAPGSARSLPEALGLMQGRAPGLRARPAARPMGPAAVAAAPATPAPMALPVPVIVFHGDADRTVHPRNGEQVVAAARRPATAVAAPGAAVPGLPQRHAGTSSHGLAYTRTVHAGQPGLPAAEHWLLHGIGHAWSGGRKAGSYTDPRGPDASREMLRFFLAHPRDRG